MGLFSKRRYDPNDSEYSPEGVPWSTRCASDPRFNMNGYAPSVIGAMVSVECAITRKARELGVPGDAIPQDIEMGGGIGAETQSVPAAMVAQSKRTLGVIEREELIAARRTLFHYKLELDSASPAATDGRDAVADVLFAIDLLIGQSS
jgi:hypothetical protein